MKGAVALHRPPPLRRLVRPPPLRDDARNGRLIWSASSQDRSAAAARSTRRRRRPTGASTSARPTARSTPWRVERRGRWSQSTGGYVYASPAVWEERICRLVQRLVLLARRGDRRHPLAVRGGWADLRLRQRIGTSSTSRRSRAGPSASMRRPGSASGVSRRQVLAGRRGARPRVPDGVHEALRDGPGVRYGNARTGISGIGSPVGLPRHELGPPARGLRPTSTPSRRSISAATGARSQPAGGCRSGVSSSAS